MNQQVKNSNPDISVQQLIVSTLSRKGDGKIFPIRIVKEVFDFDGTLIANNDPCMYDIETLIRFARFYANRFDVLTDDIPYNIFNDWFNKL